MGLQEPNHILAPAMRLPNKAKTAGTQMLHISWITQLLSRYGVPTRMAVVIALLFIPTSATFSTITANDISVGRKATPHNSDHVHLSTRQKGCPKSQTIQPHKAINEAAWPCDLQKAGCDTGVKTATNSAPSRSPSLKIARRKWGGRYPYRREALCCSRPIYLVHQTLFEAPL